MTVLSGQTENAGHFLQLATIAIGHRVIDFSFVGYVLRAPGSIVSVPRQACNACPGYSTDVDMVKSQHRQHLAGN